MNEKKISIITVNYNDADGLGRTIQSVISQTYKDFEYIVIDGGSSDSSTSVIKSYEPNISYWISETDNGIYHAMNKGVAQAHGVYCLFLNSGDTFYDERVLEKFVDQNVVEDIVVGKILSDKGHFIFTPPQRPISLYYLYSGTVPHQSSFIKTDLLRRYPYDENLKIVSDWKFFVQAIVLHNCSIKYVDEIVAQFDTNGVSTTNPEKMWKEKERVLSELFPPRVLADYQHMKASECFIQELAPELRQHYRLDKLLYLLGKFLIDIVKK